MPRERWILVRSWQSYRWLAQPYTAIPKHGNPEAGSFITLQQAAASLAKGAPVSIESGHETEMGEYAIVTVERGE